MLIPQKKNIGHSNGISRVEKNHIGPKGAILPELKDSPGIPSEKSIDRNQAAADNVRASEKKESRGKGKKANNKLAGASTNGRPKVPLTSLKGQGEYQKGRR